MANILHLAHRDSSINQMKVWFFPPFKFSDGTDGFWHLETSPFFNSCLTLLSAKKHF